MITDKRSANRAVPWSPLVVAVAALCLSHPIMAAPSGTEGDFPYVIQVDPGATEFAPGDGIVISSLRGDREHLEPGGHYLLEGTYTLASGESADLAWFSTSRGPSGSTPVADDQHVNVSKGSGKFRLKKTVSDDGWLHVSFYVDKHSHGGIYFGEKGNEKTVLRKKGWSDFSDNSAARRADRNLVRTQGSAADFSDPVNQAILSYLGNPVRPPANLDEKYTPKGLADAFTTMSNKAGWQIQQLGVDDSEFPFLVYGKIAGRHELSAQAIREMKGYDYSGSVRGSTDSGSTYFSLNMIPRDQYPSGQSEACQRRLMVRMQMLADTVR